MIEKYLDKNEIRDALGQGMVCGIIEKNAQQNGGGGTLGRIFSSIVGLGPKALDALVSTGKAIPQGLGWTMLTGAGAGVLGASGYDVIKEMVSKEDPEAKFNQDVESIYKLKTKELDDAKWMTRVRSLRDRLIRDRNKLTTKEYAKLYKELSDALDERKENV